MLFFRKIKSFKTIIIIVVMLAFAACKSNYAIISIENLHPAKEELPREIQSITLMNRSMNNQFRNHREDSLQQYFYSKGYQLSKIVLDSMASDTTIRALAGLMFDSGRYDVVVPLERNFPRGLSYELLPDTLSREQVRKICSTFNTDALMVLEQFSAKTMTDYSEQRFPGNASTYNATLDVKYQAYFRIYKPEGPKTLFKEISVCDTIYWESDEYSIERLFSRLPSIKQALISAGIKVALDVDSKLSPSWIAEKRGYFLFKQKNDQGQAFIKQNDYAQAANYWAQMAQSNNAKIRSKAEFNLVLISELNGDIDKAIEYGLKSFYSSYRVQTEIYLKKLEARKLFMQKTK